MSNYPDDIRSYDHDPRSPFYVCTLDVNGELTDELMTLAHWVVTIAPNAIHASVPEFTKRLRAIIDAHDLDGTNSEVQLADMDLDGNDRWDVLAYMHDAIAEAPLGEDDELDLRHLGAHLDGFKAVKVKAAKPVLEVVG